MIEANIIHEPKTMCEDGNFRSYNTRINVTNLSNEESQNYAGKERIQGGVMHGGWTTITYIGDRQVNKETTYLNI